jgi:hypothetical protein
MTLATTITQKPIAWTAPGGPNAHVEAKWVGEVVREFLDTAVAGFGKATHYNSEVEVVAAERQAHQLLLELDRDLYAAFLALPGVTDRSRQLGVRNLLSLTRGETGEPRFVSPALERALVYQMVGALPPPRMLKMFESFRAADSDARIAKANNSRTRKLILRTILRSPRLELWAVKYRDKVGRALTHAMGERKAGIVRSILSKPPGERNAKEIKILREEIARYADGKHTATKLYACLGFALGATRTSWGVALLDKFELAKRDLRAGKGLPIEVLEGIRGQFHKNTDTATVLELSKTTLTAAQRMTVQRKAKETGVKVDFDPTQADAIKLYIYAFEMGMTDEIAIAMHQKAHAAAQKFPLSHERIGILVDASRSMFGDETQKLRPMATALALRDMLAQTADSAVYAYAGGRADGRLVRPDGDTSLAKSLLELVAAKPDAIYVLSDGYENAPAGRFAEVVRHLERIGIVVPIHHLNPVVAAESKGVRELAPGMVPTLPARQAESLGISILRHVLDRDPVRGINALLAMTPIINTTTRKELSHAADR